MTSLLQQLEQPPQPPQAARLTRKQAAAYIGTTPRSLDRLAWLGRGPAYCKVGRFTYYRKEAIESWLLALEQERNSAGFKAP